ncbi:hypothetical protein T492DRAFT_855773 [Pavlovales sp. CCMP2436]|nr:hypothetical protein T492DRAFT_855773 [Pavlovales sp. CCMP2436]
MRHDQGGSCATACSPVLGCPRVTVDWKPEVPARPGYIWIRARLHRPYPIEVCAATWIFGLLGADIALASPNSADPPLPMHFSGDGRVYPR